MSESITTSESKRLLELEEVIERGLSTFIQVGEALAEIRDSRLYRVQFSTFEEYCREEWEMSKTQANRLIAGSEVAENLTPNGVTPRAESQVRPLTQLPPSEQPKAWEAAVQSANGAQPTAAQVQTAVASIARPLNGATLTADEQQQVTESEQDSETLWSLKRHWRKATKKERAAFTEWAKTAR